MAKQSSLIQAVAYVRRSDDSESQKDSIPEQRKAIQQYAEERGFRILRWYEDDAISGDDTKARRAFLQMIADAGELNNFEAILCWDKARFGRFDSIEAGYYIYPLREAGVYLATVMEGVTDWNDPTGRIVGQVMQEGKHQQLIDHSGNVTRGQLEAANKGSWIGSPPYAYRVKGKKKKKRLVLGEDSKVRVVKRIFHEFVVDGRSMMNIADRLQAEGFPSPGGRGKLRTDS
jgi:DNA invertase Pin-like site-specific DNA recombinase